MPPGSGCGSWACLFEPWDLGPVSEGTSEARFLQLQSGEKNLLPACLTELPGSAHQIPFVRHARKTIWGVRKYMRNWQELWSRVGISVYKLQTDTFLAFLELTLICPVSPSHRANGTLIPSFPQQVLQSPQQAPLPANHCLTPKPRRPFLVPTAGLEALDLSARDESPVAEDRVQGEGR